MFQIGVTELRLNYFTNTGVFDLSASEINLSRLIDGSVNFFLETVISLSTLYVISKGIVD